VLAIPRCCTFIAVFAMLGCGSPSESVATSNDSGRVADSGVAPMDGPAEAAPDVTVAADAAREHGPCDDKVAVINDATWKLTSGGRDRFFAVHLPTTYNPHASTPLILNFHGYNMDEVEQEDLTHLSRKSDSAGFIVVTPRGTGSTKGWNAGDCCGDAVTENVDDVAFTRAMLDERRSYASTRNGSSRQGCRTAASFPTVLAARCPNGSRRSRPSPA
jgi:hypothetical protein